MDWTLPKYMFSMRDEKYFQDATLDQWNAETTVYLAVTNRLDYNYERVVGFLLPPSTKMFQASLGGSDYTDLTIKIEEQIKTNEPPSPSS